MGSVIQQFFAHTSEDGTVATICDGRFTQTQVIIAIVTLIAIILILRFIKGIAKLILGLLAVGFLVTNFSLGSPTQVTDTNSAISRKGSEVYEKLAETSESIKFEDNHIYFKNSDTNEWIDMNDVQSFVMLQDGTVSITVGDTTIAVNDKNIIKLLKLFSSVKSDE